jgi:hypothetical protein
MPWCSGSNKPKPNKADAGLVFNYLPKQCLNFKNPIAIIAPKGILNKRTINRGDEES